MTGPVIQYDYDFSPYAQKTRLVLTAAGVDYRVCDQPVVLPRKDLEKLGITHRRIPLLAVGKDVYADSSLIIDNYASSAGGVPRSPADRAYETWGNDFFQTALSAIPSTLLNDHFIGDRKLIFPILARPGYASLRPSALGAIKAKLRQVEYEFLSKSSTPFIGGDKFSVADAHVFFGIRWVLDDLKVKEEPGFGKDVFPRVYRALEALPATDPPKITADEAFDLVTKGKYASLVDTFETTDPLAQGLAHGREVCVESADAAEASPSQVGKIVTLTAEEIVVEVGEHNIHVHFPRIGYVVRAT